MDIKKKQHVIKLNTEDRMRFLANILIDRIIMEHHKKILNKKKKLDTIVMEQ